MWNPSLVLAILSGIAIAAACGLRAFLPLFALGLAARFHWITLQPGVSWLATDHALWALGVATVVELAADKIPVVDHALDGIGTLIRPAAAWLGAYAMLGSWPTPWAQLAALVLGTSALLVHVAKAKLRLTSTAVTLGHANPLVSFAEDILSLVSVLIAVLIPIAVLLLIALVVVIVMRRRRRAVAVT